MSVKIQQSDERYIADIPLVTGLLLCLLRGVQMSGTGGRR